MVKYSILDVYLRDADNLRHIRPDTPLRFDENVNDVSLWLDWGCTLGLYWPQRWASEKFTHLEGKGKDINDMI